MHFLKRIPLGFIVLPVALMLSQANAQFVQQGGKLVGAGAVGNSASQGGSVSLSSDGNTAIVGGGGDSSNGEAWVGAAWVFTRTGGVWSQDGNKLVGAGATGYASQGSSVAISSDGNTAIVGGPQDNGGIGASWVFIRSGGVWSQQGNKLVSTDSVGSAQGSSVSISSDGNTALVGGPGAGAAWVFTRTGNVWSQQGSRLVGTGTVGGTQQGWSVSLSSDGNTAIVGGPLDSNSYGASWVFTRTGDVWSQQGSKLVGTGAVGGYVYQGFSVSLSSDGNTAIVGGPYDESGGGAWVFTRIGSVWSQQGSRLVGTGVEGPYALQGASVSVSSDGNTVLIGGYTDADFFGAAWVFTRTGGLWSQLGNKLVGTDWGEQGWSVSLSSDGNTAILGAPVDTSNGVTNGAAWVFTRAAVVFGVTQNWNLISVPVTTSDYRRTVLFPSSTSSAYTFDQGTGYVQKDTLKNGPGYWLKFATSQTVTVPGELRNIDTVDVKNGWNIIGSISHPADTASIIQIPTGIVTSSYYGYNGSYTVADILKSGNGYWVKVNQNGKLVLR